MIGYWKSLPRSTIRSSIAEGIFAPKNDWYNRRNRLKHILREVQLYKCVADNHGHFWGCLECNWISQLRGKTLVFLSVGVLGRSSCFLEILTLHQLDFSKYHRGNYPNQCNQIKMFCLRITIIPTDSSLNSSDFNFSYHSALVWLPTAQEQSIKIYGLLFLWPNLCWLF